MPKKPPKRFDVCMGVASEEQNKINFVIEGVIVAVSKVAYNVLQGEDWLGLKVRVSTNRIPAEGENDRAILRYIHKYVVHVIYVLYFIYVIFDFISIYG